MVRNSESLLVSVEIQSKHLSDRHKGPNRLSVQIIKRLG